MERRAGEYTAELPDATRTSATEEAARPVAGPSSGAAPRAEQRIIRWDRFLPWRFLRVLLVEHDDSTRQIVTVLLRKCSYQVAAVADGLIAWTILMEGHYKVDLVLTEVMTPSLSGIDLLSKIMSNEVFKNLPVIMMSSQDSMGIVFNCMLKGAADFLVKPVRKNELRNLWQHVWRRRCSGSTGNFYGNENPGPGRIGGAISENNIASNRMSINAGHSLKTGQSCEKGSDTQSSCGQTDSQSRGVEGLPYDTEDKSLYGEAQLHARKADLKLEKESAASTIHLVDDDRSKAFEQRVSLPSQATSFSKQLQGSKFGDESAVMLENAGSNSCKEGSNDPESDNDLNDGCSKEAIDFIGGTSGQQKHDCKDPDNDSPMAGLLVGEEHLSGQNENVAKVATKPSWELSLNRSHFGRLEEQEFQHKHILNHSNASAFSRYGDKGNHHGCMRSCAVDREFDAIVGPVDSAKAIMGSHEENSCEALATCQHSKRENSAFCVIGPSADDSDSTCRLTKKMAYPQAQVGVVPMSIPVGAIPFNSLCTSYGALLQPIFYPESGLAWHHSIDKKAEKYDVKHAIYSQPHAVREHNSDHHNQRLVEQEVGQDSATVMRGTDLAQNASSRSEPNDYASNHDVEDRNAAADNISNFGTNNVDIFEASNSTMMDHDRSTRREAALTKFRLKRKNRCFEKKVRYHSRKKLAEQRPRLKGQFVRQTVSETKTNGAISDE
ncbi:unnamed protein product [Victoria cruziana]